RCLGLRDVGARDDLGNVTYGEQRNISRGQFTGIERPIRDHSIDGTENLRITKLRFCSQEFAFCRFELAGSGFQSLLFANCVQSIEMFLRHFILVARIGEIDSRLVEFFAWHSALLVQILAAVVDLLLRFIEPLGRLQIELGLLHLLWKIGGSSGGVGCFSLLVCAFIFLSSSSEIAVFQGCEQLAFMDSAGAFYMECFHRSADFWSNSRLL